MSRGMEYAEGNALHQRRCTLPSTENTTPIADGVLAGCMGAVIGGSPCSAVPHLARGVRSSHSRNRGSYQDYGARTAGSSKSGLPSDGNKTEALRLHRATIDQITRGQTKL